MSRSARHTDQSLDIYSDDDDNSVLTERIHAFGDVNADESGGNRRATPARRQFWRGAHLWPARLASMLCSVIVISFIAVLVSFLYIVLKGKHLHLEAFSVVSKLQYVMKCINTFILINRFKS